MGLGSHVKLGIQPRIVPLAVLTEVPSTVSKFICPVISGYEAPRSTK